MKTILVVDDEVKITRMISDYLESLGYGVRTAGDGKTALEAIQEEKPDCVVLDIMMPGIDGIDVTRRARDISDVPILLLTARAQEADKLMGLEIGADDYMVKPFSMKELAARVRALIRRAERFSGDTAAGTASVSYGDFTIDEEKMAIVKGNTPLHMTAAQFKIVSLLFRNPGKVFSRMQLLESFQDMAFEGYERTIDVHIKNIRKIVEEDPAHPLYIVTVWGTGYKAADLE
jgi:DNA-binding response OmpR family regulator